MINMYQELSRIHKNPACLIRWIILHLPCQPLAPAWRWTVFTSRGHGRAPTNTVGDGDVRAATRYGDLRDRWGWMSGSNCARSHHSRAPVTDCARRQSRYECWWVVTSSEMCVLGLGTSMSFAFLIGSGMANSRRWSNARTLPFFFDFLMQRVGRDIGTIRQATHGITWTDIDRHRQTGKSASAMSGIWEIDGNCFLWFLVLICCH